MPRAGWCRECGEWVWVDEAGGCQNGHGPECIGGVYEAEEKLPGIEPAEPGFGAGELPHDLNRFNWGAFFMPLFWSVGFGAWSVLWLWMIMATSPIVIVAIVGSFGEDVLAQNLLLVTVIAEVVAGAIRLWIGANANRLLWTRERLRLEFVEGARPRFSAVKFAARQRTWASVGVWFTLARLAGLALLAFSPEPLVAEALERQGATAQDVLLSGFWLLAEIALAWWLAGAMRRDAQPQELPPSADA